MMVFRMKPFRAATKYRMGIGKSINRTMQHDAFLDVGWIGFIFLPTNAVGHKVADLDEVVVA